jgi:cytochrome c2
MKFTQFTLPLVSFSIFTAGTLSADEVSQQFNKAALWESYGEVKAEGKNLTAVKSGDTLISNIPGQLNRRKAPFLQSKDKFKDLHMKMEFMVPKGSNSGVYFMGRYEIQILDSFGKAKIGSWDLGGLYERHDDEKNPPAFEGVAPKVNAAKAPGEWQTMEVIFRAPRFSADGSKTHHAKFVKVLINDQLVHENQVAKGPTRSSAFMNESAAPESIFIQGDHGPIAIRNVELKALELSTDAEPVLAGAEATPLDELGKPMVNMVELGKQIFAAKGCVECHGVAEGMVKTGPSQWGIFTPNAKETEVYQAAEGKKIKVKADVKYLTDSLRRPTEELSIMPDGKNYMPIMPPYDFKAISDEEILALHSYLISLNPKEVAGPSVVWKKKLAAKYDINTDAIAIWVKEFPRIERVDMGENVSGRAYHVGLPGDLNYSFDPRSMAIAQIWDGPFLRKEDQVSRGRGAGQKGFKHRIYSDLDNLFQAYDAKGNLVDLTFASPAKLADEAQSKKFLADKSDFLAEVRKFPAKFLGVETPKQQVPKFSYSVGENEIDIVFNITKAMQIEATFNMNLKSEQQFFIPKQGLQDAKVSVGTISDGKWIVPAGQHKGVTFTAGLPKIEGGLYTSDITATESYAPQELKWTKSTKAALLDPAYEIQDGSAPKDPFGRDLVFEPLGIEFYKDQVFVSTRTAGVWKIVDNKWHLFAEGAYESIGMVVNSENDIVIGEKPGLTRLIDQDGDNWSEKRINLTDQFRFNGDYHEYVHGPIKWNGKYLFILNLGNEVAGMYKAGGAWMGTVGGLRGWMLSSDEKGNTEIFASGFRSPAGLTLSPNNEVVYTENQGEYVGTSKIFKVQKDKFYGNPTGLLDIPGMNVDSPETKWAAVKDKREKPVVLLPHGKVMNSPGSPEYLTDKFTFGPFENQMFLGDQTKSNIYRIDTEVVDGQEQGVAMPFAENLKSGAMRLRFDPADSSLWIGQTGRGWQASGGSEYALQRIVFDPKATVNAIKTVRVTKDGFEIHFTQPQEKTDDFGNISCASWYYSNSQEYGSPARDQRQEKILSRTWNDTKTVCTISIENFHVPKSEPTDIPESSSSSRVYFIDLEKTPFAQKSVPQFAKAYYTLHKIPQK